jgi:hypothetical protein
LTRCECAISNTLNRCLTIGLKRIFGPARSARWPRPFNLRVMRHESYWTKEVSYMQLTKHNWFAPRIVRAIILYLTVILLWSSPGEAASIEQKQDGGLAYRKVLDYSPTVVPGPVAPRQYGQGVHEFKNYHVKDEVSFYIPPDDIQGFVIEKAPVMRRDEAHSPWYHVTFSVSRKAGQQHAAFANHNGGQAYELSLAGN